MCGFRSATVLNIGGMLMLFVWIISWDNWLFFVFLYMSRAIVIHIFVLLDFFCLPACFLRSIVSEQVWLSEEQRLFTVSNSPGNLLEFFSSWKSTGNLQCLLEIFWFIFRVYPFVVNISYNSCISECISTKYVAVNQHQLILRSVISVSVS